MGGAPGGQGFGVLLFCHMARALQRHGQILGCAVAQGAAAGFERLGFAVERIADTQAAGHMRGAPLAIAAASDCETLGQILGIVGRIQNESLAGFEHIGAAAQLFNCHLQKIGRLAILQGFGGHLHQPRAPGGGACFARLHGLGRLRTATPQRPGGALQHIGRKALQALASVDQLHAAGGVLECRVLARQQRRGQFVQLAHGLVVGGVAHPVGAAGGFDCGPVVEGARRQSRAPAFCPDARSYVGVCLLGCGCCSCSGLNGAVEVEGLHGELLKLARRCAWWCRADRTPRPGMPGYGVGSVRAPNVGGLIPFAGKTFVV